MEINHIISLKNQFEFLRVSNCGIKRHSKYFLIISSFVLEKERKSKKIPVFLGMKVSKKLSKKAVIRNRIKRVIRNIVRKANFVTLPNGYLHGMIIIPKKSIFWNNHGGKLNLMINDCESVINSQTLDLSRVVEMKHP